MTRGVLVLVVCGLVASVEAGPQPWTLKLPPDWKDITPEIQNMPAVVAAKRQASEHHGHVEIFAYSTAAGDELDIKYGTSPARDPERSMVESLLERGRQALAANAQEIQYWVEWEPKLGISSQKLFGVPQTEVRAYVGFGLNGTQLGIFLTCVGDEGRCGAAITGVVVDRSRFRDFDSLDELHEGISIERIAKIVGGVSMLALCGLLMWKRRKSAAAG